MDNQAGVEDAGQSATTVRREEVHKMEEAGVVTEATDRGKSYGGRGEAQRQAEVGLGLGPSRPVHRK